MSNLKKLAYAAFSQRGQGKAYNEDALLISSQVLQGSILKSGILDASEPSLMAVADGVSSQPSPRAASRKLQQLLAQQFDSSRNINLPKTIHRVRDSFVKLGREKRYRSMATTLVVAMIESSGITILNTGDSRAYLIENGKATLLSRDHTVLQDLLDDGEITPAQAANAASIYNGLTAMFIAEQGIDDFQMHRSRIVLKPSQFLLLCTDGLYEKLSASDVAQAMTNDLPATLALLYRAARQSGASDDISMIALQLID